MGWRGLGAALGVLAAGLSHGERVESIWLRGSGDNPLDIPFTTLNNGVRMPMVGLGTWEYNTSTAYQASLTALQLGYRHIDTAVVYGNQKGVGRALAEWENNYGGKRSDVFITTKIPGGQNFSEATKVLQSTLNELGVDYVDLMLVHMPSSWDLTGGPQARIDGWLAMEEFLKKGKARALGVSHFCRRHLEDIVEAGTIKPSVNQVEFHVGMGNAGPNATDDRDFVESQGILYQSFSPLCGPCNTKELITGPVVKSIGKKYGKTGAQVSLRWQVQQGIPVIPKTTLAKHMLQNADLFSWSLSDEDMATLTNMDRPPVTGGGGDGTSGDCKIA